ncbi:MAG TPA: hypothetical protein VGN34_04855, partial [Ktedonobacteraceae bacterium]
MRDDIKERLYRLLPSLYRQRDQAQGYALRAFMSAIENEFLLLETDMDTLYENWFIETADDWVIPYIGDLLGVSDLAEKKNSFFSQRRRVANTTGYRRRKGLPAVLEHVAQDVTGWPARVVEYRQLLAATPHLSHVRPAQGTFIDLHRTSALAYIDGPFDTTAHTVDVRQIGAAAEPDAQPSSAHILQGKYRPDSLGLFLWRLQSYQMTNVPAGIITRDAMTGRTLPHGCFTFDPLQRDLQLFSWPQEVSTITGRSTIINTPDPISRAAFASDLKEYATGSAEDQAFASLYYGPDHSLSIILDGAPVPPNAIIGADLSLWQPPHSVDAEKLMAVDVELGRIMVFMPEGRAHAKSHTVETTYCYGFNGEVGGGPYIRSLPPTEPYVINVLRGSRIDTLKKALAEWDLYCEKESSKPTCTIRILDNRTYAERNLTITLPNNSRLIIEAAHGLRPCINLIGHLHIRSTGEHAHLLLNGLLINSLLSLQGNMQLDIVHCTLMPHGIEAHHTTSRTTQFQIMIDHSIVGPLQLQHGNGTLR